MLRGKEPDVEWNGDDIKDLRLPETAIPSQSRFHVVRSGEMLDMIAYKHYGDESKWYIIADVNEIMDVMVPLTHGTRLVIPPL